MDSLSGRYRLTSQVGYKFVNMHSFGITFCSFDPVEYKSSSIYERDQRKGLRDTTLHCSLTVCVYLSYLVYEEPGLNGAVCQEVFGIRKMYIHILKHSALQVVGEY